jgi:Protein of unknown function (DUF3631)
MAGHPNQTDRDNKVVELADEHMRRLQAAAERLARQSPFERAFWLDRIAKKQDIEPAKLKALVDAVIREREQKQRAAQTEQRRLEQRAERQRATAKRAEERQQREQQRAQERADKEAARKHRERDKELTALLKLPKAEREPRLALLAKRLGEDIAVLRSELALLIAAAEKASAIEALTPWPEPVDSHALLVELMTQLRRYVVLYDDAAAVAITLWISFAWLHEDIATHSPILGLTSADADAGKTTACGVLKFLTPRAYAAAELTGPNLYRFVDQVHPTLIIDDADRLFERKPDLVHIVNVGWTRGTKIPRQERGETRWFDPFCPKVVAGVNLLLPRTTATRVISLNLLPKLANEKVTEFDHIDDDRFVTLRRKLARWAADNADTLKDARPNVGELSNRIAMNWKLMLAVADLAGGDWPKLARAAAVKLARARRELSTGKRLLLAFRRLFDTHGPELTSAEVQRLLLADEEGEWAEFRNRSPITKRQIALLLDSYGIHPDCIHPHGRKTERGYKAEWFETALKHFLVESMTHKRATVRNKRTKSRK